MAFGFPAYYKARRNLIYSKVDTKQLALKVFEVLEWSEIGLHPFALDFKTLGTMMTSGERFYVNITETEIIVRSESLFFSQIIDFGKNKSNILLFWKTFDLLTK